MNFRTLKVLHVEVGNCLRGLGRFTCQRHLGHAGLPIKIGKEMPPTGGTSWVGEIDCGFACYLVFAGCASEVEVEQRLLHVSFRMAGDYTE